MDVSNEPLPRLKLDGSDNSTDVIGAMVNYKQAHSPQQTEDTIHQWFDLYDRTLADAIQTNLELKAGRQENHNTLAAGCPTGQFKDDCEKDRMKALDHVWDVVPSIKKTDATITHLQMALDRVRRGMLKSKIRYDWFQIRASDGNSSY